MSQMYYLHIIHGNNIKKILITNLLFIERKAYLKEMSFHYKIYGFIFKN